MTLTSRHFEKFNVEANEINVKLTQALEQLEDLRNVLDEYVLLTENGLNDLQTLTDKVEDHNCYTCQDNAWVEYRVNTNRDDEKLHEAIETTYVHERAYWERQEQQYKCASIGCNGTLWAEYIENARYLIKCSNKCRIIWTQAPNPYEALQENAKTEGAIR